MTTPPLPHIVPVLSLPHLVFFPRTDLALHIPRPLYERVKDNTPGHDCFLGILLRKLQPSGDDDVFPIGCVGRIKRAHPLPCGQSVHLDLHGVVKFVVREGWFEEGFGNAWIKTLEDKTGSLSSFRKSRLSGALEMLGNPRLMALKQARQSNGEPDDETFLNLMCFELTLSPMEKYFLLEAEDLDQRAGRLLDLLWFKKITIQADQGCQKDR